MSFRDGDFVKIDYSMWRASDNALVRTTDKKLAQEKDVYEDSARYVPQLIVIGKDRTLKAIWDALRSMNVGESKKLELEPKDAFGVRDSSLVRVMPISDFRKRDIEPRPGMQIDIDGAIATVKSVNSGRVMVDANHPLAGEKLIYDIRVVGDVEKPDDKIRALAELHDLMPEKVELDSGTARLLFGEKTKKDGNYFVNKQELVASVLSYIESVKRVVVEEDYLRPEERKESEPKN